MHIERTAPSGPIASGAPPDIEGRRLVRLVTRAYRGADDALRARMLSCLLKPLGTLGIAAVAAGAFGRIAYRRGGIEGMAALTGLAAYSRDQVLELAHFANEVNPDALRQVADLLADNAGSLAGFTASALLLLYRGRSNREK